MKSIYSEILIAKATGKKLLAILLDPDKVDLQMIPELAKKIIESSATHILVGGSIVQNNIMDTLILSLKENLSIPIILFPGHPSQISTKADGLLFLSLLSGRNPEYLIEHHINSVAILHNTSLEIIPTGYILIDGNKETAVQRVSNTKPIAREDIDLAFKTAKAGEYLGKKLIYLEAGSGALNPVPTNLITPIAQNLAIPIIVGGGIRSKAEIEQAYAAGADMVVIGTAFELDSNFFNN